MKGILLHSASLLVAFVKSIAHIVFLLGTLTSLRARHGKAGIVHRTSHKTQAPRLRRGASPSRTIANPLSELEPEYDVVIVGSGYGASVAASRMARATPKMSVCVLERGIERWPGDFPETARHVIRETWVTGSVRIPWLGRMMLNLGKSTGLYQCIVGIASSALVGNGLGGTSLLNGNIFLRATQAVLQSMAWPAELRQLSSLDKGYERAEAMLEPTPCPENGPNVRKYDILEQQARACGLADRCYRVPLTTSFHARTNAAGVKMRPSSLSGHDVLGVNDGSKSTTLVTYLADAWTWGAKIFCSCEVRFVRKAPNGGYIVYFRHSNGPKQQLLWVRAKRFVFLGAGAIGTTEIMLRSEKEGLPLSTRVGTGYSGNGSMLSFGYNLRTPVNALASTRSTKRTPGPTITGCIDLRQTVDPADGISIQEGVFPPVIAALFRMVEFFLPTARTPTMGMRQRFARFMRMLQGKQDPLQHSQVYLTIGHDHSVGKLTLHNDSPVLDMSDVADTSRLARLRTLLVRMTHALGGDFKASGLKVTVHPLGGMCLASDGTGKTGAICHTGETFTGAGSEVHDGLVVVDGSAVPCSLGSNPLATITALAERSVELVASRAGLQIDYGISKSFEEARSRLRCTPEASITFSETMTGHLQVSKSQVPAALHLHIKLVRAQNTFKGFVSGCLACGALSIDPLLIHKGTLNMFEQSTTTYGEMDMVYDLDLVSSDGRSLRLSGVKHMSNSAVLSPSRVWAATTTLSTTIKQAGKVVGFGELRISPIDFMQQLQTMQVNAPSTGTGRDLLWSFLAHFTRCLAGCFFAPFMPLQYPEKITTRHHLTTDQKPTPTLVLMIEASDGVKCLLHMWEHPRHSPVPRSPLDILFIPGAAVSHEIFALPTIHENAIDYFVRRGHRCWCVTTRVGKLETGERHPWTAYDARLDVAAALDEIQRRKSDITPPQRTYVISHCAGSVALASGVLDGTTPTTLIAGITASNVFLHPLLAPLNQLKAHLPLLRVYQLLAGSWYSCLSVLSDNLLQTTLNSLLRFYPQSASREICNSVACHRSQLAFGRLWSHANLNHATHLDVHKLLDGISIRGLQHQVTMGLKGEVTDNAGRSLLTESNLERLRGIAALLISGAENAVYSPNATAVTFNLLSARFGSGDVRRVVFPGLGHLDCWMSDRSEVVFRTIQAELNRVGRL